MSIVLRVLVFSALIGGAAGAQAQESCDAFLLAPRQVKGKPVGPKSCLMQETSATFGFSSMSTNGRDLEFKEPKHGGIDTACIVHRRELIAKHGSWKDRAAGGYAHDWELVKRWLDASEAWVATGKATLLYNAETSGQVSFLAELTR